MLANSLKIWDTIWIIAPSNRLLKKHKIYLNNFIKKIEQLWFKIILSNNIFQKDNFWVSTSSPEIRAKEMNKMFANKDIKLIWCYQWWNSINQILKYLDYKLIQNNPKILIWKSDSDILLLALNKKNWLITFHWCDSKIWDWKEFDFEYTQKYFIERLVNKSSIIENSNFWENKCIR